jgi:hypothetical protein
MIDKILPPTLSAGDVGQLLGGSIETQAQRSATR